ncbi:hypothetical protein B0H16DRAFT_1745814 [Mycena metata]|uniref:Uncharacterized protein n=1 Tax=Mycena metata TaxID=1033252 RepID=A0AAD7MBC8_9AGAR|nr:hypothetical protein B0H16DRAFT_1745814 [Mycena metata]
MAPRTWHNDLQKAFFTAHMPGFVTLQRQSKTYRFWGPMYEAWFRQFPEETTLGYPVPGDDGTRAALTPEELKLLGAAIVAKKKQIRNYFNNNSHKLEPAGAKQPKSNNSLARMLFKAKPSRERLHKPIEIFQMRNNESIREACTREGHDSLNEESFAAANPSWVDETDDAQVRRVKDAAATCMMVRTRVIKALFAEASEEELQAIADILEREKAGEVVAGGDNEAVGGRTPAEYMACVHPASWKADSEEILFAVSSIHESWDVVKKVHKILEKMTGWYGFTMWGGPNPEIGGELSMKSVSFGLTPAGNDFEQSHASFEKDVEVPFQHYLRRCFPANIRLERALDPKAGVTPFTEEELTLDPRFRIPNPQPTTGTVKPKPKRKSKSKKKTKPTESDAPALPVVPLPPVARTTSSTFPPVARTTGSTLTPPLGAASNWSGSPAWDTTPESGPGAPLLSFNSNAANHDVAGGSSANDSNDADDVFGGIPSTEFFGGKYGGGGGMANGFRSGEEEMMDGFGSGEEERIDYTLSPVSGDNGFGMPPVPTTDLEWMPASPTAVHAPMPASSYAVSSSSSASLFNPPSQQAVSRPGPRPCFTGAAFPNNRPDGRLQGYLDVFKRHVNSSPLRGAEGGAGLLRSGVASSSVSARAPPVTFSLQSALAARASTSLPPPIATTHAMPLRANVMDLGTPLPEVSADADVPMPDAPRRPAFAQSRPPTRIPELPKSKAKKVPPKAAGRKRKAPSKSTAQQKAKTAANVSGKRAGVSVRQAATVAPDEEAPVLTDQTNTEPVLIHSITGPRPRRAANQSKPRRNPLHNPDGNHPLVCVPVPREVNITVRRTARTRNAPKPPGEGSFDVPVKRTREQIALAARIKALMAEADAAAEARAAAGASSRGKRRR